MKLGMLLMLFFSIVGCSFQKKGSVPSAQDSKKDIFQISLNLIVPYDDVFEVYYLEGNFEQFNVEKKVKQRITGKDFFQQVVFNLPKELVPNGFRIDLGENPRQNEVHIREIEIKYNTAEIVIKDSLLPYFFVINNFLVKGKSDGEFTIIEKAKKRDPFLTANPVLLKKIKIEL